jgi:hypothetical protein
MTFPPQRPAPALVQFDGPPHDHATFWGFIKAKHLQWFGLPVGGAAILGYLNYARSINGILSFPGFEHVDPGWLSLGLYGVIILTLVALLAILQKPIPRLPIGQPEEIKRAQSAVVQFVHQWKLLWAVWVLFYLVVGFQRFLVVAGTGTHVQLREFANAPLANVALHALNNAQTVVLYLCYYVITWTSLKRLGNGEGYEEHTPTHLAWVLLAVVTLVEAACALLAPEWENAFAVFSGFGCGAAMAMVVGRLESKYAGAHPVLVFLFYVYALLQMTFLVFGTVSHISSTGQGIDVTAYEQDAVAALALLLKVVLFAFVYWLIRSHRLLYYMVRIHDLNERVEGDWGRFARELQHPQDPYRA